MTESTCLLYQLQSGGYQASKHWMTHSDFGAVCTLVRSSQSPYSTTGPAPDKCVKMLLGHTSWSVQEHFQCMIQQLHASLCDS